MSTGKNVRVIVIIMLLSIFFVYKINIVETGGSTTVSAQETDEKILIPDEKYWETKEIHDEDGNTVIKITGFDDYDDYHGHDNWDEREAYRLIIPSSIDGKKVMCVEGEGGFFRSTRKITSIVISEGIEEVGYLDLEYEEIVSIELPVSLKKIGDSAFSKSEYLNNINIPDNVTEIGSFAFGNCKNLKDIQLPDSLYYIENRAFYGCISLKYIHIPSKVAGIYEAAFADCRGLEAFTVDENNKKYYEENGILYRKYIEEIPVYGDEVDEDGDPVVDYYEEIEKKHLISYPGAKKGEYYMDADTTFEWTAFLNVKGLTAINADKDNPDYTSVDGVLYTKDMKGLCVCPAGKSGEYTVPEGVYYLQTNAFSNSLLHTIHFPDSLGAKYEGVYGSEQEGFIGNYCFYEAPALHTISLGKSINEKLIKYFITCESVNNITISDENPYICAVNNIIYDKEIKSLIWISPSVTGKLVLPDTVEEVARTASSDSITELFFGKNYKVSVKEYYDDDEDTEPLFLYAKGIPSFPSLQEYSVSSENLYMFVYDGVLYSKDLKMLYRCPPAKKGIITIPEGTTTILGESFTDDYEDGAGSDTMVLAIPVSVTDIQESFSEITIKGYLGSAAHKYAENEQRKITFIALDSAVTSSGHNNNPSQATAAPQNTSQINRPVVTAIPVSSASKLKPGKIKISRVKSKKNKSIEISWKKQKKTDGYQLQYSVNKRFKPNKVKILAASESKIVLKKLASKKSYYIRIRSYRFYRGKKIYGDWSGIKKCKVK